jgi:hypothetical protein
LGGAFLVFFFFLASPTRRWQSSSPLSGAFTRRSTIEIRRGGTDLREKATGLFPVAFIDLLDLNIFSLVY